MNLAAADLARAGIFRGFRETVAACGGDADAFLREVGLAPTKLADPDDYIPFSALIRVLELASERLGRNDFGLLFGGTQSHGLMGPLSVAAINSKTARDGVECVSRFVHFHNRAIVLAIEALLDRDADLVWQDVVIVHRLDCTQLIERQIAYEHTMMGRLIEDYAPIEVWFRHAPVSPPETYERVFGVRPRFNERRNGIVVSRAALDAVRPGRSEQLRRSALMYIESLDRRAADSFSGRVRATLLAMMGAGAGAPQSDVADALALHERTLQRRLKDEGVSFEEIKDGVRREMAERLLGQRGLPLSHVAEMLGYSEAAAFSRSCRRWFGEPPRDVRKRLAGAA